MTTTDEYYDGFDFFEAEAFIDNGYYLEDFFDDDDFIDYDESGEE